MDSKVKNNFNPNKNSFHRFLIALLITQIFVLYSFEYTAQMSVKESKEYLEENPIEDWIELEKPIPLPIAKPQNKLRIEDPESKNKESIPNALEEKNKEAVQTELLESLLGKLPLPGKKPETNTEEYFFQMHALFPGGEKALENFLKDNLRYPPKAIRNRVDALVWISFVVNKKGEIENIKIVEEDIEDPYGFQAEAIRVVKQMPNWQAAIQGDKFVSVKFVLPIRFEMQE
jgi:periplasmic protein TonB